MKKKNARSGGRFLSALFVIIRTFLQTILNLAPAHMKSSRMCHGILGDDIYYKYINYFKCYLEI